MIVTLALLPFTTSWQTDCSIPILNPVITHTVKSSSYLQNDVSIKTKDKNRVQHPTLQNTWKKKKKKQTNPSASYLMACSRWAFLTSGFWFLLAMMSLRVAPVIALWNFVVLRVLFFVVSSVWPFLYFLLYRTVQLILRGFLFIMWDLSHLALMNWKTCALKKVLNSFIQWTKWIYHNLWLFS